MNQVESQLEGAAQRLSEAHTAFEQVCLEDDAIFYGGVDNLDFVTQDHAEITAALPAYIAAVTELLEAAKAVQAILTSTKR